MDDLKNTGNRIIKPVSIASETSVGTPIIKMRTALYMYMYEIAIEHKELAKIVSNENIINMKTEIKEAMISILFSYTCLEAFINIIGKDYLKSKWEEIEKTKTTTQRKWMYVSDSLSEAKNGRKHSIFNIKKEPFKSFSKLEKIREDYIVHRKGNYQEIMQTKYGNTEGTINIVNCQTAEWACKTVKDMVKTLCENIDNPPPIDWLN
jgi:hypothetical protein